MFRLTWIDDETPMQLEGDFDAIIKELIPFFQQPSDMIEVELYLTISKVGQCFDEPGRYQIERIS